MDFKVSGAFGALNVLKNSWNFAHRSEPIAIRAGLKLVPGRGRGARQRPLERGPQNLVHRSNTLAWINMKLNTHIDLIGPNNFPPVKFYARPTGSPLFRVVWKTHAMEFKVFLLEYRFKFHETRSVWSQDIEDEKLPGDFWYLERFGRGEETKLWREMWNRKCVITSAYINWSWWNFSSVFAVRGRSHGCDYCESKL